MKLIIWQLIIERKFLNPIDTTLRFIAITNSMMISNSMIQLAFLTDKFISFLMSLVPIKY